jgi:hypothetical protein
MLLRAAARYSDPRRPPGCLIISEPSLAARRADSREAVRQLLREGQQNGEIPSGTDLDALSEFYAIVIGGMSARARDGATYEELLGAARTAMQAWPQPSDHN